MHNWRPHWGLIVHYVFLGVAQKKLIRMVLKLHFFLEIIFKHYIFAA
jgi:hypothetical protein